MTDQPDIQDLTAIASKHLFVETLRRQGSDTLDFHDCAVWAIEAALREAWALGYQAGLSAPHKHQS